MAQQNTKQAVYSRLTGIKDMVSDKARVAMTKNEYVALYAEVVTDEKWGPAAPDMDRLARAYPQGYPDLLPEMQYRLDQRDSNWRKCYKTLLVLDHFARNLDDRFMDDLRAFMPMMRDISNTFKYVNSKGVDHGRSVRERARKVCELMADATLLAEERRKTATARRNVGGGSLGHAGGGADRFAGFGSASAGGGGGGGGGTRSRGDFSGGGNNAFSSPTGALGVPGEDDLAIAMRLQAEENRRAGRELAPVTPPARPAPAARTGESDFELAMRLQEAEGGAQAAAAALQRANQTVAVQPPAATVHSQPVSAVAQPAPPPAAPQPDLFGGAAPAAASPAAAAPAAGGLDLFGAPAAAPSQAPAPTATGPALAAARPGTLDDLFASPAGAPTSAPAPVAPAAQAPAPVWGQPVAAQAPPSAAPVAPSAMDLFGGGPMQSQPAVAAPMATPPAPTGGGGGGDMFAQLDMFAANTKK